MKFDLLRNLGQLHPGLGLLFIFPRVAPEVIVV